MEQEHPVGQWVMKILAALVKVPRKEPVQGLIMVNCTVTQPPDA